MFKKYSFTCIEWCLNCVLYVVLQETDGEKGWQSIWEEEKVDGFGVWLWGWKWTTQRQNYGIIMCFDITSA